MTNPKNWHLKTEAETLAEFRTNLDKGLNHEEVEHRRSSVGPNVFEAIKRKAPWKTLLDQFADILVLVLITAALISLFLGEPQDSFVILAIITLNGILGFTQEYRAEKAMEGLQTLMTSYSKVKRLGKTISINSHELVPGDIVLLESGSFVPADVRLIQSESLKINESALTGESNSVEKISHAIATENLALADQRNMAFKGTLVTSGRGTGVVVHTGMKTELGKIAKLLSEAIEVDTPLQRKLARFAKNIAAFVVVLCVVIFVSGFIRGELPILMFLTALSLAVAAIPEALPAVVSVALAFGTREMSKKNALVRKLAAVEALGSVTFICSDKTGTLTENRMTAQVIRAADPSVSDLLFRMLALSNDASLSDAGELLGEPTETALLAAAMNAGWIKLDLEREYPRIAEIPFSAERAMMTTVHQHDAERLIFSKGAFEAIFSRCKSRFSTKGIIIPIDVHEVGDTAVSLARQGYRVLAFAFARIEKDSSIIDLKTFESNLIFVGLIDPPRKKAKRSIELCFRAGIHPVMITGDHPETAKAIATRIGLMNEARSSEIITGRHLSEMTNEELKIHARGVAVFARVAPEQKIRIVTALQEMGEIVAMTGDGVNDAPALKQADIGVAMGKSGTDVAREAANLNLLDDNFATLVDAVREGRRIYDNIRKFILFVLSGNSGEIWVLFLAPFLGLPTPLLPIQILWINLITDGLPGLALAFEPEEQDVMRRPPRNPKESIFARGLWQHCLWVGLLTAGTTLGVLAYAYKTGNSHWQSMTFTVLALVQMGHVFAIRSETDSLLSIGVFSNLYVLGAVVSTFTLQMICIYSPLLNSIFKTVPLSYRELSICLTASLTVFIAVEIEKKVHRKKISAITLLGLTILKGDDGNDTSV